MIESMDAVKIISKHRGEALIVADMTPGTELPIITTRPELDLPFNWAAMGKGSSLSLGLALARPDRKVMVTDCDGSLLNNLGSIMTIGNMAPPNLIHFLFDNGVYRCTGGQSLPKVSRVNFSALALEAGYPNIHRFSDAETFEKSIDSVINEIGPTFVHLKIVPATGPDYPYVRVSDCVNAFREALAKS
ncbi:MAG: thiamine pyrophosphate-binding protein [Dehalococcoidia bacterium]|nr:thiamine pyrophosphate-binding protein [Dehalococcoidia bacterium]